MTILLGWKVKTVVGMFLIKLISNFYSIDVICCVKKMNSKHLNIKLFKGKGKMPINPIYYQVISEPFKLKIKEIVRPLSL